MRQSSALGASMGMCAVLACWTAQADPTEAERAQATSLFKEAKALMDEQRYAEACRKFEDSQRLDPGGGTLLNLAVCHEQVGRAATALAEFKQALETAKRDGRDRRVQLAEEHIAALE